MVIRFSADRNEAPADGGTWETGGAAAADGVCPSYLTALCNTESIPSYQFALVLAFSSPRPSPLILPPSILTYPSALHLSTVPPRLSPSRPPPFFFLPAFLRACARPVSLSMLLSTSRSAIGCFYGYLNACRSVIGGLRVGSGHAGWVSMWREENIWFIRPVGQRGKRVTRPPRHQCASLQIQSTLCSSGRRSERAAQNQRIGATI